jgi:regulation of enolase protein 1 (concanavalin A-like superfamily)
MWGKGNKCSNLVVFQNKYKEVSVGLTFNLLPKFDGEQAGIILFINNDNYIKFVREMVNGKQTIVLAKEINGIPSAELILPCESSSTKLHLKIQNDSITLSWNFKGERAFQSRKVTNWFRNYSEFQIGLLVHGDNSQNQAEFNSLIIDGRNQPLY